MIHDIILPAEGEGMQLAPALVADMIAADTSALHTVESMAFVTPVTVRAVAFQIICRRHGVTFTDWRHVAESHHQFTSLMPPGQDAFLTALEGGRLAGVDIEGYLEGLRAKNRVQRRSGTAAA
jgi:hypothetical protein